MEETLQITEAFKGQTLIITGGTGSFGSTVLKTFLTHRYQKNLHHQLRQEEAGLDETSDKCLLVH